MRATTDMSSQQQSINAGFTLIELMITIAIIAIIVTIAAPNVSTQLANQRVKSTASTLENALKEAKAESIIRRQSLTLVYNNNSTSAGSVGVSGITNYSYNAKSTIESTLTSPATVSFEPSKRVNNAVTYTICDSNASATPRQIVVTKVANITNQTGGTCS